MTDAFRRDYKNDWQREQRREFQRRHGFSTTANYAVGGIRRAVLERDGYSCCRCAMTAAEHMATWGRQITVDHKDRNRANNALENLQTLCLSCLGANDHRSVALGPIYKPAILRMRREGKTYAAIADFLEMSIGTVYRWDKRWREEAAK